MLIKYTLLLAVILLFCQHGFSQQVRINEVMASNATTLSDENGDYEDWIELFNASENAINLQGFGLSDNPAHPFRWIFPNVILEPGQHLLVWASGKNRRNTSSPLHTNFRISADGEEVVLTAPSGMQIDALEPVKLPTDISIGRQPDGAPNWVYFKEPTPAEANTTEGFSGITPSPEFSIPGGFYSHDLELILDSGLENTLIYYTLDGSPPDHNAILYSDPISLTSLEGTPNDISLIPTNYSDTGPPYYEGWHTPQGEVFKINVVRALAVKEGYIDSRIATHSFLIDEQAENRYSLPVFSLNTYRENLFNQDYGIYVPGHHNNMFQRGVEWERPAHLEFFENDGQLAFASDMGVRIHGGTTRSRARKSLRLYARNQYGDSWVQYPLFPEKSIEQYKRFILRNSGNDWDQAIFRDGFMQYLARNLNVETQYYRPAVLFINGEYWGIHNIRDRYDQHYIFSHYGLEEDQMTVMENNSVFKYGNPVGRQHYNSMRSFINHNDISQADNYAFVTTLMDPESFADAQIANIFIMNTDWPGNNTNYWRRINTPYIPGAAPGMDGRWRWHILDTDFGFWLDFFYVPGVNEGPSHNTLAMATQQGSNSWPNYDWSTFLLRRLLTNDEFRVHFINRFADLLNTTFREDSVIAILDSLENSLAPEMQEHIRRWGRPESMQDWHKTVQRMRTFAQQRPDWVRQHIRSQFSINGNLKISLEVNNSSMGSIRINTIEPDVSHGWEGIYFRGIPLQLEAIAAPGYRFTGWSGYQSGSRELIEVTLSGDAAFKAHFEPSGEFAGDELNPPPYPLKRGAYTFNYWDQNQPEGTYPPYMLFLQSSVQDPRLTDEMTHRYHIPEGGYHQNDLQSSGFPYKLTGRSRINGLGPNGISFINTGRNRDLGAAVLALDTRNHEDIIVSWTGGTIIANSRAYAIRLQYKTNPEDYFKDVLDANGNPVEYVRSDTANHEKHFSEVALPSALNNREYVLLRWKYYYTGTQNDPADGSRDMLRLDNIMVNATDISMTNRFPKNSSRSKFHIFPNPTTNFTYVAFELNAADKVSLYLYDSRGRRIKTLANKPLAPGLHTLSVNLNGITPGVYLIKLNTINSSTVQKMIVK